MRRPKTGGSLGTSHEILVESGILNSHHGFLSSSLTWVKFIEFHQTELMKLQCWEGFCAPLNLSKLLPYEVGPTIGHHTQTRRSFAWKWWDQRFDSELPGTPKVSSSIDTIRVSFVVILKLKLILRWNAMSKFSNFSCSWLNFACFLQRQSHPKCESSPNRMFQPVED